MIKNLKKWLSLMILFLSLMAVVSLDVMAEEANVNDITNVPAEEFPVEPVGKIEVKTIETKTADGLLVQETSVPKSQLIYALSVKDESIIQANALDAGLEDEIMTKMESAIINLEPEVNLSKYQIPYDEMSNNGLTMVSELFYRVLNDNFDLFYMAPKITTYYDSDKMVSKVVFTYVCDGSEVTGQLSEEETLKVMYTSDEYKKGKSDLIYSANISEAMSDIEKVLAIHDALCKWANYDYSYKNYYADGIFIDHSGVCQAYTYAFHTLLSDVGIADDDLDIVISYSMNHAWNMVRIDGEWYHVDATWDDNTSSIERTYFMKSDEKLKNHSGWSKYLPVADSDRFDNYFASDDYMYYEAGKWYYRTPWPSPTKREGYCDNVEAFACSNIDGSDKQCVLAMTDNDLLRNYVVLNGKIYYNKDIKNGNGSELRNIYSCNIDGTNDNLFKVVSDDAYAYVSELYITKESLNCIVSNPPKHSYLIDYNVAEKLTITSFTADKRMGQPVNTDITLSATVSSGTQPTEYRFYYKNESDKKIVISDFSSSRSAVFRPELAGYYDLYVEVKDSEGQVAISKIDDYQIVDENSELAAYYTTHVQNIGWQDYVSKGEMSGTEGQGLRLEGLKIELTKKDGVGIKYTTHVQNIGWQDYVTDGEISGTSGRGLRLEAVKMELTGENANKYDIYYRVHAQNVGWMGWASNGTEAGTAGFSYRLEGIEIKIVEKEANAPGSTDNAFIHK